MNSLDMQLCAFVYWKLLLLLLLRRCQLEKSTGHVSVRRSRPKRNMSSKSRHGDPFSYG